MDEGIRVGRLLGFTVRLHWSVLVILWLFTWSLATTLPSAAPQQATAVYWLAGACGAVLLLASLLAHELTHAVVARTCGLGVRDVQLWLFGGVAVLGDDPPTARAAFRVAVAGPLTSVALALCGAALAVSLQALRVPTIVVAVTWWVAGMNLFLALFNLLPAAPLDGGQILRAMLWKRSGDATRATVVAARAGAAIAVALAVVGLLEFVTGSVVAGVWMIFIAWFLFLAAREQEWSVRLRRDLDGVVISDVMTARPHVAPGWITVEDFVQNYLLKLRNSSYPVVDRDGGVTGLVSLRELRRVPPERRSHTFVGDVAVPLDDVVRARPDESLTSVWHRMGAGASPTRALVFDDGRLIGIVTSGDLLRAIDVATLARRGAVGAQTP